MTQWFRLLPVLVFSFPTFADELSVESYLKEVRNKNEAVAGAILQSEGSQARSKEGELSTTAALFSDAEYRINGQLPLIPITSYDSINMFKYNLGVKKTFSFGLDAKLYYSVMHTNYVNQSSSFGAIPAINFFDTTPTLELSQQLWGNGFGRTVRARQDQAEAGMLATSFANRHLAKSLLASAEEVYWALSLARERKEIAHDALEQAKKIYKWNASRVERNLADEVDALQSKAALEASELDYQLACDTERQSARAFNKMRNVDSDVVEQDLPELEADKLLSRSVPESKPQRDDVKAAEQQQRAAIAGGTVSKEGLRPTLEVYGTAAMNGRNAAFGAALQNPFEANRPTWVAGVRFNMPLDRSLASQSMAGVLKEQMAAEMSYRQKQKDLVQDWQDLTHKIKELKYRLKLSKGISATQKLKLQRERQRLTSGRTTTFQVLQFEQDFSRAKLGEIGAKTELVRALTQLKLYGGSL